MLVLVEERHCRQCGLQSGSQALIRCDPNQTSSSRPPQPYKRRPRPHLTNSRCSRLRCLGQLLVRDPVLLWQQSRPALLPVLPQASRLVLEGEPGKGPHPEDLGISLLMEGDLGPPPEDPGNGGEVSSVKTRWMTSTIMCPPGGR